MLSTERLYPLSVYIDRFIMSTHAPSFIGFDDDDIPAIPRATPAIPLLIPLKSAFASVTADTLEELRCGRLAMAVERRMTART